ncbi:MAG: Clp protease N-terminal domain-containing protein [Myxococcota bacterium]
MGEPEPRATMPHAPELAELLAQAQRTALESTHATVTIEHLLLAFVDADHAKALLQVDAAGLMSLRSQLVSRLMQANDDSTTIGRVPPEDPALSDVLRTAEGRARSLGLHLVDVTSVLAALLEASSPVATWLTDLGVKVATPPPSLRPAPMPPTLQPPAPEDEDIQDTPTEEATMPSDELEGPASLVSEERPTDPGDDDEDDFEEWAAPTKVASGLERDRVAAEAKKREEEQGFAGRRPSLEPAPWNLDEFDDDIPTVNAGLAGRADDPTEEAPPDEEPTRVEPESPKRKRQSVPSLIDEAFDAADDDDSFSVPPPAPPPDIADGRLAENIPRRMRVDRPEMVQVRLGKDGRVDLRRGMRGSVTTHRVALTQAMSARLVAPDGGFTIELTSPETQWIDDPAGLRGTPAEWTWTITPIKSGKRPLQLVVGARTIHEGLVAEAALPLQIIEVEVSAHHARTLGQAVQWLGATAVGAVLGVFSEEILKWAQGMFGP